MFHRILVPLDGSTRAESALPIAARIARRGDGTLILLRVVPPPVESSKFYVPEVYPLLDTDEEMGEAREYLKTLVNSDQLAGLKVETHVQIGKAAPIILDAPGEYQADLIIVRSHGFHGLTRWTHGSVAQKLVHHSPVPLLVLREDEQPERTEQERPPRILVTLDGSLFAETALRPAAELAATLAWGSTSPAQLQMFRVLETPAILSKFKGELTESFDAEMRGRARQEGEYYLSMLARSLTDDELASNHLDVRPHVAINDDVAEAIVQTAEQEQVDIIAMATHGRGGVMRWALGSITERVMQATRKPLLLVRVRTTG